MGQSETAAAWLNDDLVLARAAASELSDLGTGCVGACIITRVPTRPVVALAKQGVLAAELPSPAAMLRSFFIDPLNVPVGQRDRWVDPVRERVVSPQVAATVPVVAYMQSLGVNRSMRHLVCLGPRAVGVLVSAWHARTAAPMGTTLNRLALAWRPIIRARALIAEATRTHASSEPPAALTPRQLRILTLVAEGLSNQHIATRLRIAPSTVKTVLERLYERTGARGRMALVRWLAGAPLLPSTARG